MIKPNTGLKYIRPDEVAECWDKVPELLYTALWNLVPRYKKISLEDNGPHDVIGINSVASFWRYFTPEEQVQLNALEIQNRQG